VAIMTVWVSPLPLPLTYGWHQSTSVTIMKVKLQTYTKHLSCLQAMWSTQNRCTDMLHMNDTSQTWQVSRVKYIPWSDVNYSNHGGFGRNKQHIQRRVVYNVFYFVVDSQTSTFIHRPPTSSCCHDRPITAVMSTHGGQSPMTTLP